MKRYLFLFFASISCLVTHLEAQHSMGLMVGDFNSPYSYSLNPALSRTNPSNRAYINWWGASVSGENNFMQYNAPFRLGAWINESYPSEYRNINGSLAFQQNWLPVNTTKEVLKLNYLSEVYGPSFFIPIDEVGTFGFGIREVSGFSINGVNGDFGGILRYGMPHLQKHAGKNINQNEFSINTEKYQEWFMNFAGITKTDNVNVWKWGATMKFLIGMGLAHLGSDNLNFGISNNAQSLSINQFNGRMFRSGAGAYNTLSRPFGMSFDFAEGAGMGMDLGVVYEYRPHGAKKIIGSNFCDRETQQQYDWKFGASITDLGFINYWGNGSEIVSLGNTQWTVDPKIVQNTQFSGQDRLADLDQRLFQKLGAQNAADIFSSTPVALNVQFDKNLGGNVHMGAYWTQNLKRANSVGLRRASYLNVTPRWQTEQMEYGVPVTIANDYTALHVGMYGRLGPVIIGTDNLVGLGEYLNNEKFTGANFYFGVRSKIGGCDKRTRQYSYIQKETFYDTLVQIDTQQVKIVKVQRDTIVETKKETVTIKTEEPPSKAQIALEAERQNLKKELENKDKEIQTLKQSADLAQKECQDRLAIWVKDAEKCKKTQSSLEEELKKKNAEIEIKQKEWAAEKDRLNKLLNLPKSGLPKTDTIKVDCAPELAKKQAEIDVLEGQRNKAILAIEEAKKSNDVLLKKCEDEKKNLQDYLDKIQADLTLAKKSRADLEAENKILKDQIDRLSKASTQSPCDAKLMDCEKNLLNETRKNASIALDLERERAKVKTGELAVQVAENKAKAAAIELSESKADALKWKTAHDQLTVSKKICDDAVKSKDTEIATLKAQIQTLKAENESLKRTVKTDVTNPVVEDCTPFKTRAAQLEVDLAKAKADMATALAGKEDCTPFKTRAAQLEVDLAKAKADLATALAGKEDCTPFKTRAAQLEADLAKAKTDLAKATTDVSKANTDLAKAKADLATALAGKEDCTPFKTRAAQLEVDLAKAKADLAKATTDVSKANTDLAKAKADLATALAGKEDCTPYKTRAAQLEVDLAKAKADLAKVTTDLSKANTDLTKANTDLSKANTDLAKAKADLATALAGKEDCTPFKTRAAQLEVDLAKAKADAAKLDSKPLQDTIIQLKAQITLCQKENASRTDASKALQDTIAKLKAQIVSCQKDLVGKADPKPLQDEITKLKAQIQTLEAENKTGKSCEECETALKAANANVATANAKLQTSENTVKELQAAQNKCNSELTEVKKQLQAALSLKVENDELKKKIAEMETLISELEGSSDATTINALNEEIKRLKADIVRKDNQISGCKLLSDQCNKKLAEVEVRLADSEKARTAAQTEVQNLKKQITTLDEDMAKLGEIIKSNNAEISKLNAEVSSLKTKLKTCETKLNATVTPPKEGTSEEGN
jgi:predicted  nucleic acid-binding Zn-ribbon protein